MELEIGMRSKHSEAAKEETFHFFFILSILILIE